MNYIELSLKNVRVESKKLFQIISKEFKPDVILFVEKGGFPIGKEISKNFKVPLFGIIAKRKKNKLKEIISPILKIIPKYIKIKLRKIEIKSGLHNSNQNKERYIKLENRKIYNYKTILLVDDSVDSGETVNQIVKFLEKEYKKNGLRVIIKVAAINVFDAGKKMTKIDYYLYENLMISGPWSKDSKFYKEFINEYNTYKSLSFNS